VRYKSPLRYPGGKAKLAPFIQLLFEQNKLSDGHYAEPYAGGASVALSLLYDEYARHIHINDFDRSIYAFWFAVLNQTEDISRLVRDARLSPREWRRQRAIQERKATADLLELGFSTFYLNRTNRSGIIASGGMIGGNGQVGPWKMDARFNRRELVDRIQRVATYRSRISLTSMDAIDFLAHSSTALPERSLTYLDPPYFVKGQQRLYANYYGSADHVELANLLEVYPHCWVVSYDYAPEILTLYQRYRCLVYDLRYTAAVRQHGSEVMFLSDQLQLPRRGSASVLATTSRRSPR
jgi:DNA adenine methylase